MDNFLVSTTLGVVNYYHKVLYKIDHRWLPTLFGKKSIIYNNENLPRSKLH